MKFADAVENLLFVLRNILRPACIAVLGGLFLGPAAMAVSTPGTVNLTATINNVTAQSVTWTPLGHAGQRQREGDAQRLRGGDRLYPQ
jgi:hypothetical protein